MQRDVPAGPIRGRAAVGALLVAVLAGAAGSAPGNSPGLAAASAASAVRAAPAASRADLPALEPMLRRVRRSVVRVIAIQPRLEAEEEGGAIPARPRAQAASGVVLDDRGHVVTTARAIAGCIAIRVRTSDGREVTGNLLGLDPVTDLALVRIPAGLVPPVPLAPVAAVRVGAPVITVGHSSDPLPTQDLGRITWRYHEPRASLIQMTNTLQPGNSGGAAVDRQGRLLGVLIGGLGEVQAAESLAATASARGAAFAVPVDDLVSLVDEMRRFGGVRRGFLGVSIQQGLIDDPEHPGAPAALGVQVSEVIPGGPAWRAGLRAGDLIVAIEGVQVNSPDELMRRVTTMRPGATPELLWVRQDREFRARVQLGSTPDSVIAATLENASRGAFRRRQLESGESLEVAPPAVVPDSAGAR